jgi:site-specific DNA recombinase
VGELKKGKYVYYHCTGNRGKCPEPYTRQEILASEFANILRGLVIPQPVLEWLGDAVVASDRTEQAAGADHQEVSKRGMSKSRRASRPCTWTGSTGASPRSFSTSNHLLAHQAKRPAAQNPRHPDGHTGPAPIDQAIDMLRLTSRAGELFLEQSAAEQRRLPQVVVEKTCFEPFEILRHSDQECSRKEKENGGSVRDLGVWLPKRNPLHNQEQRICGRIPQRCTLRSRAPW